MTMIEGLLEKKLNGNYRIESEPFGEAIRCSRCEGFMVVEQGFDSLLGTREAASSLRRCVQCGEVIDPVILQNRRLQRGNGLNRTTE